jgi:predicted amidohydrolase YtcJ
MSRYTRSEFLRLAAAAAAAGMVPTPGHAAEAPPASARPGEPDLIVLNGRVYTSDPASPSVEAFAVENGRFTAVGRSDDVSNLRTARTEVLDARGRTVVPGFIDAHSHPAWGGVSELLAVNCDLRSIAEITDAIHKRAASTPPGEWIIGFKYDDTKTRDKRRLRREDLDQAAPNNPVQVQHRGGHLQWYNSRAFALAGVTVDTPDPPGGRFVHRNGQLDGCVEEKASEVLFKIIPMTITPAQVQAGIALMSKLMTAAGLTSVTDAECSPEFLAGYQDAYHAGDLRFRTYVLAQGYAPIFKALTSAGIRGGIGDDYLRLGGAKWLADGSAQERTMRMSTPYVGRPNDYGILTMTQEEIDQAADEADRYGFQIGIHANGDVAIDMVLKAYERVKARGPRREPYRPRIEHCSLVNPDLLARIKKVGAVPTPFYTYVYYHGDKWAEYGDEKMRSMFAHASFFEYGIPVASGSDYIPGPYEPMMALQSMVTRKDMAGRVWGANQRITLEQALQVCTINAAYASFDEHVKGSITPGKLADFVVLEKDPHGVNPDEIVGIKVLRTVVGGKTVHSLD